MFIFIFYFWKKSESLQIIMDLESAKTFKTSFWAEFRFESPISISKLNNHSDFRSKSENYFKVKVFSDCRPKYAQKLILKVFVDSQTQIICRLSDFFQK